VRHPHRVGLTANFNSIFGSARTEYVMVLADDDDLEPDYLERCVALLDAQPDLAIVSGGACYFRDGVLESRGVELDLEEDDPATRVRRYFAGVRDNVTLYGVMRREAIQAVLPMRNSLAGDWLLIGRVLMLGKARVAPETWVNRSVAGTSESFARTVRAMGLTRAEARHPHLAMARLVHADVARDAPAYAPLGTLARRRLALASAAAILRPRLFNIAEDALRPHLDKPGLRTMDRHVRPIVRRVQR
jgi:hypothetical protein